MIFEVLQIITEEVNGYFEGNPVSLDNIATLDSEGDNQNGTTDIVLSLLNTQEESTLKNDPNKFVNGNRVSLKNPKVNLNLYIIFGANHDSYAEALKSISKIIEFFQGKKVFTQANSIYDRDNVALSDITNFKFIVELYTPSFEELNFVWGTLGGKQIPSVLYKIRLIQIERDTLLGKGGMITEIGGELKHIE